MLTASGSDAPSPHSLSAWLLVGTAGCLAVLLGGMLGSANTGLHGGWLTGDVVLGGQIFLATVGLTEVRLQNQRGSQSYSLPTLCEQNGPDSVWCALDTVGAQTETVLTIAFAPALVVMALSLLTVLRNCMMWTARPPPDPVVNEATDLGPPSAAYNATMLLLSLLFWVLTMFGLFLYAFGAPASLGMGEARLSESYGLLRACVLYASIGSAALLSRALALWDTVTAQRLIQELVQARFLKQWLCWLLLAQLGLYLLVALSRVDYAAVPCLLGLNYLVTKSPQMLWAYVLLVLITLPQDVEQLALTAKSGGQTDTVEGVTSVAFRLVVALKCLTLIGMAALHTNVRFKLLFIDVGASEDGAALDADLAGRRLEHQRLDEEERRAADHIDL